MIPGMWSATRRALPDSSDQPVQAQPTPLLPGEAETILKRMGMDERKTDIDFELNETVKVIDGPFANFTGSIEEIDYDKSKVKVFVNMFGRETPVELNLPRSTNCNVKT